MSSRSTKSSISIVWLAFVCERLELGLLDDDVAPLLDLVALDDLVGRHLLAGLLGDPPQPDARAGVLLELVERDVA